MAAPRLSVHNIEDRAANFYTEQVAARFAIEGFRVTTEREIAELIGLERQKQLLGCSEDSAACMAELANALGVETVLTGEVAKIGKSYQLLLKVLEAGSARVLSLYTKKLADEEGLVDEFALAASAMAREVAAKMNRVLVRREATPEVAVKPSTVGGSRNLWWLPAAAGVALATGGGVGLYVADGNYRAIAEATQPLTLTRARQLQSDGRLAETLGIVGIATGAAAVGVGAAMLFFGGAPPAQAVFVPQQGGAYVQVQGVFP